MAVRQTARKVAYSPNSPLQELAPLVVEATRNPTTKDFASLGTTWVNKSSGTIYMLAKISTGVATWTTSPASGVGTFTSVDITTGDLDVQAAGSTTTISSGTVSFDNGAGTVTMAGDLTVAGTTTLNGDLDLTSAALIDLISTLDAAPSILLEADGGTSEQIQLHSDQGTSATSIYLLSDDGGITLQATTDGTDDAINLAALNGGIDVDAAAEINIDTASVAVDAMQLISAGGIDVTAAGGAGSDIDVVNTAGSINLTAGEAAADSIALVSSNGGIDITADGTGPLNIDIVNTNGSINLNSGEAAADSMSLVSAGGFALTATGGAASDIVLTNTNGSLQLVTGEVIADSVDINSGGGMILQAAGTGGLDTAISNAAASITFDAAEAAADALYLYTSDVAGGLSIDTGTGGINGTTTGAIVLDADAASSITMAGAGVDMTLESAAGRVILAGGEAAANAVTVSATDAAGGVLVSAGTGEIQLSAAGAVSMVPDTDTQASPTAASTINARVFKATFTGFTTAAAATETFTLTNSAFVAGAGVMVTVANGGANDAQMTLTRVNTTTTGTLIVQAKNNGAAALNGDIVITGWIID